MKRGRSRTRAGASAGRSVAVTTVALAALVWLGGCGSSPSASPEPADLGRWDTLELPLDLPVLAANPFDPAQAGVRGELESPGGESIAIPAFVTGDFTRTLEDGREHLTATSDLHWLLRFAPAESGAWRWRYVARQVEANGESDTRTSEWRDFRVGAPRDGQHGWVRPSPRDPRYLSHDDGTPFLAIGENLCWYDERGTFAYDDWLEKLAAQGATFVRLWMPSWAFGLEWIERAPDGSVSSSSLGDYQARLDRAWQLDQVIEKARSLGIEVMLSIQNHGPFSTTQNSEWLDNPYNAANGGPLGTAAEFFTAPAARELFERRLRYLVARYGHASNVLAWELFNEVDLADSPGAEALVDWHRSMARVLLELDSARRPVTTSLSGTPAILDLFLGAAILGELWQMPEIAFTQVHLYSVDGVPLDFSHALPLLAEHMSRYGKPRLTGEAGVDFRGPAETLAADPDAIGLHDMLWSGVLGGGFGTGMTWWWDNVVDPGDEYFHFGAFARFVAGVAFDDEGFAVGGAGAVAPDAALTALALRGHDTMLVWVKNDDHQWFHPDETTIAGATVAIEGGAANRWRTRWIDPYTGAEVGASEARVENGTITVGVPPFSRDIALRLERE